MKNQELNSEVIKRVIDCNRRLAKLEHSMLPLFEERFSQEDFVQGRSNRLAHLNSTYPSMAPWEDVEKDAILKFGYRGRCFDAVPSKENLLTVREVPLMNLSEFWADDEDHGGEFQELRHHKIGPVCWLFHDLFDHGHGYVGKEHGYEWPRLELHQIADIGEVWIDVITCDQVWLREDKNLPSIPSLATAAPHALEQTDEMRARVMGFNRRLAGLQQRLIPLFEGRSDSLQKHLEDQARKYPECLPWMGFKKSAEISFYLREDDPSYLKDDDNILTTLRIDLSADHQFLGDGSDYSVGTEDLEAGGISQVCWMLHEIVTKNRGPGQKMLSLCDVARIGDIWIDIITVDQFMVTEG